MRNIAWKIIEAMALPLTPTEREIVLGDLMETRGTAWRAMREVLGLVARRQLQLWYSWRPWLAAPGLALPCSFMLMGFSFAISSEVRNQYGRHLSLSSPSGEILSLLCQVFLLLICAWAVGSTIESVSRRTLVVSVFCCFLPCLFCLIRFHQESPSRFCLLLFLFPAIAGACFSRRGGTINRRLALGLALAATICMAVLEVRGHLWVLNWELIVPVWYQAILPVRPGSNGDSPKGGHTLVNSRKVLGAAVLFAIASSGVAAFSQSVESQIVDRQIISTTIADNRIGASPVRKMAIYLPPGYHTSARRYPVIYFFPNPFEENYRFDFDHRGAQSLFDHAIAEGVVKEFILVAVDMNTPLGTSWYVNSSATGNWEDFVIQELVPYVDATFKTLPDRDSRGIAGIFIGGYGAIRLGMRHPDVFGSVYAMHPVGTGTGVGLSAEIPKWDILANAKSIDDVKKDARTQIFTTMFQAHLPDPDKPPLFIDLLAHQEKNRPPIIDAKLMERFRNNFYLETMIGKYADNLNSLRGFKFDWNRSDANFDHVYANQAFTRKLREYGISHQAEEYNGTWDDSNWGTDGRFFTEVLPFFARYLIFNTGHQ